MINTCTRWIRNHINWFVAAVLVLSLVPILYCSHYNYASADEFSKSFTVHNVLLAGGNLWDAIVESARAAVYQWETIEGTWSSNFFLAFQPSIWGEHAYRITVPLCILYAAAGSAYLFYEILVEEMQMSKRAFWFLFWAQLFLFLQYMPFIRGGMFWYVGMAHYIMPMFFVMLMIAWMLKWFRTGKRRYFIYMLPCAVYMGGSHYQHILIVLLVYLTGWLLMVLRGGNRKVHLLWIPIVIILVGLYICVISPGNVVRGQETFGVDIISILLMPLSCVVDGARHAAEYIANAPLIIVYAMILWCIGQNCVPETETPILRKVPSVIIVLYLYLLYASTEAPAIYAKDNPEGISGAYYDTVYHTLILVMTVAIPIVASRVRRFRLGWKATVIVCLILTVLCIKPSIKHSSTYVCYDFIQSGRLEDFEIQMEERLELLNDPALVDVYVPEMNNEQGPFMHLQLSQDSTNYTNEATTDFYNKNSVTAVPREEYYAKYAQAQGHEIPEAYREQYGQ